MASANGALTPPSLPPAPSSPSLAKRKRAGTDNAILSTGASTPNGNMVNSRGRSLQTALEDIVSVLKSYDIQPSILKRAITSATTQAKSVESGSKRAKLTPPHGAPTISGLVQDRSYDSLDALDRDIENATSAVLESLEGSELSAVQLSVEQTMLQGKVLAFKQMAKTLISREEARISQTPANNAPLSGAVDGEAMNGEDKSVHIKDEDMPESRTVLTLYGSAQGPKQLFSSLQQPVKVSSSGAGNGSGLDTSVQVTLPLRESSLPNIISTTQVFPLQEAGEDEKKKKTKTFRDVFGPPAHIPQLSPPKLAKPATAKGNTITFAPQEPLKPSRRTSHSYPTQNLSTGHWLGYGGVDLPKDPTSPTAKQKSRQRALSTGEAQLPPSEATLAAVRQAKEDALFRSAYSSFAPSHDDATAIVPEETKNKVWWQKVGEKRFNEAFPIDPALLEEGPAEVDGKGTTDEDRSFKDAVENFAPAEADPFESVEKSELEKSTNEILEEISELLETLSSHQRIRNMSLATNPRTPVIQNSSLASLAGSPSTPSSEEIDVYQMLKSQLTLMIAQLPPYAVAKLNGDQLDELNISRTMMIETEDHKGVLEEDQFSRRSAVPAAAAPPSLSRMASAGTTAPSLYPPSSTQFARSTPSVHSSSARPTQPAQSYYPQQQSVHRSPSVHYQRSSGVSQPYQTPAATFASSTPRPSYSASQYPQQTPRASYGQTTPGQYYSQRPAAPASNYGATGSQYYQSTPQPHRYATQQSQNGYYQRPQSVASYSHNPASSPHGRTESPLKANPPVAQPGYHASRPTYGTPVTGGQLASRYYPPGVPPANQYGTPQPSTPVTAASGGYSAMGSNPQQMMLDRQNAQAAAQSQARMAAQNSFHRHGSGTPQPPNAQYGSQQQSNGTPMAT